MYEEAQQGHREVGVAARIQFGPVGLAAVGRHISGSLPLNLSVSDKYVAFVFCILYGVEKVNFKIYKKLSFVICLFVKKNYAEKLN